MPQPFVRSRRRGTGEDIIIPPPDDEGFRTAVGSWNLSSALFGEQPTPDMVSSNSSGAAWVNEGGIIDDLTLAEACCFGKFYGANTNVMTDPPTDRSFSETKWKALFDAWRNGIIGVTGGVAKLRTAVRNGVYRGLVGFDDFIAAAEDGGGSGNAFFPEVTFEQIEACGLHVKETRGWDWLPVVGRGPAVGLQTKAHAGGNPNRRYQYLDASWSQVRPRLDGAVGTYWTNQLAAAEDVDLGIISGINIRQGSGALPFGCVPAGARCYVSPTEIRTWGLAALALPEVCGWFIWNAGNDFAYWNRADIQLALQDIYNASVGRTDGPVNVRGDLALP